MNKPSPDEADTVEQADGSHVDAAGTARQDQTGSVGSASGPDILHASNELPRLTDDVAPAVPTSVGGFLEGAAELVLRDGPAGPEGGGPDPDRVTRPPPGKGTGGDEAGRTGGPRGHGPEPRGTVAGYEILGELGRGAMGVVYKARQPGLKRLVALKMILAADHASERDLARFRSEAEAVARLQHPNIVQIYEVGEHDGLPFFSLEFVDGTTLARKVAGTPQPERGAAELLLALARAMDCAHRAGVVHRDLKPANVLLAADGTPKITDFGLAKQVEEDSGQTRSGTILGTPSYMAPEQAEGRTRDVGPLSDVYALGAVLYELLTGRPPFKAAAILDTLTQVRYQEPVPPHLLRPDVARDLETVCLKCLHKDPARRYPDAAALADDLTRFLKGEPIKARPVGRAERLARWCRRNPGLAGLTAAVTLLLVAIAAGSLAFAWEVRAKNRLLNDANAELGRKNVELEESNAATEQARAELERKNRELQESNAAKEKARAAAVASANEAKEKHAKAYDYMLGLGSQVYARVLRSRQPPGRLSPEERALREDMVKILSGNLTRMAGELERSGVTTFGRARGITGLGDVLARDFGLKHEGLQQYQKARGLLEPVVAADPKNDVARANLALLLSRLGEVGAEIGDDLGRARELVGQAIDLQRDIAAHPHGTAYTPKDNRRLLSQYLVLRGQLALRQGDPEAARKDLEEAVRLRQAWNAAVPAKPVPDKRSVTSLEAEAHVWLGIACRHRGDAAAAEESLGRARAICESLLVQAPHSAGYHQDLAFVYGATGDARLAAGKPAEAWEFYEQAWDKARAALSGEPTSIVRRELVASLADRLGTAARMLPEHRDKAAGLFADGCKVRATVTTDAPGNLAAQAAYLRSLAHCGRDAEAARQAESLLGLAVNNAEFLAQVACCYACCAGAADGAARQKYTTQALAALRDAVRHGYRAVEVLRTEPDLESIRTDPGYREIVDGMTGR
jgi:serine/threonine-protein kinase